MEVCEVTLLSLEKKPKPNPTPPTAFWSPQEQQRKSLKTLAVWKKVNTEILGFHFTRKAGWRLFLVRLFWGVRSEVKWSTAGSHLCVTVSLEERGLSTGKDDSRILLFQTLPGPAL